MKETPNINIARLVEDEIRRYGTSVIEDRALPDFHDGLKPVQRRILWAMHKMGLSGNGKPVKSARIVGEVIGKYSPHGDLATYGAMVNLVWSPEPLIDGSSSNFGGLTASAGAYRYTNATITKFADKNFFNSEYIRVTRLVPNYDEKESEPYVLPSLLPNLLINGASGIAVGTTTCIPSFAIPGVAKLIKQVLLRKKVTSKTCLKYLEFKYPFGGGYVEKDKQQEELISLFKTGIGSITLKSKYVWDENKRTMTYKSFAPSVNPERLCEKLSTSTNFTFVQSARNGTSFRNKETVFVITLKAGSDTKTLMEQRLAVDNEFSSMLHFKMNVTNRTWDAEARTFKTSFLKTSVIDLIERWVAWRLRLELAALKKSLLLKETDIAYTKLLILAAINRKLIIQSLNKENPENIIAKGLKITVEQANQILELKVRQLSKMDQKSYQDKLNKQQQEAKLLQQHLKKPEEKIINDLNSFVKLIT